MCKRLTFFLMLFTVSLAGQVSFKSNLIQDSFGSTAFSKVIDVDSDGDLDIIASALSNEELAWFENDGEENFTKHVIGTNFPNYEFRVSDIDGDGNFDIWSSGYDFTLEKYLYAVYINQGDYTFSFQTVETLLGEEASGIFDFDGDYDQDFITYPDSTKVVWYENKQGLNFTEHTINFNWSNYMLPIARDLDKDGDMDYLGYLKSDPNQRFWIENVNNTSLVSHAITITGNLGNFGYGEWNTDVDEDGDYDLLMMDNSNDTIMWYENDGSQNYTQHIIDATIDNPYYMSMADIDADGDQDIVATAYGEQYPSWYENDGSEHFTKKSFDQYINGPLGHYLKDLDGDGDIDVIMNDYNGDNLFWFENQLTSKNINNHAYKAPVLGNYNYIYTLSPQVALSSLNTLDTLTNKDLIESVSYFDGLGRPMQQVAIRAGGAGEDLITPVVYDEFGRQTIDYLPYAESSNIGEKFRPNVESLIADFYQAKYPEDFAGLDDADRNPYAEKVIENSPLGRVLEQGAPGASWKVDSTSNADHTIKFEYLANSVADTVRWFNVNFPEISGAPDTSQPQFADSLYYQPNTLFKTITKDENWQPGQTYDKDHTTEEFKNLQGQVLLKRTYNQNQKHDTYYVYDDFGNLSFVLSPKASESDTITQSILDHLGYQYRYDHRNRLIRKKIPGKGWESIVYDKLDRPVMTQDSVQATNDEWMFTKYDVLGRVIYTGLFSSADDRATAQATFDGFTSENQYYESLQGNGVDYTQTNYPSSNLEILSINYYDSYDSDWAPIDPTTSTQNSFGNDLTAQTKSLATGSKVKVLGTSDWITSVTYYDKKARPIYVYSKNDFLKTVDIVETELDFVGKALKTRTSHTYDQNDAIVTLDTYTYDQMGRMLKQVQCLGGDDLTNDCGMYGADGLEDTLVTTETINPGVSKNIEAKDAIILGPGFEAKPKSGQSVVVKLSSQTSISGSQIELIAENTYDDLGQLKNKKVGNTESKALQNVKFGYNIRGWLKT